MRASVRWLRELAPELPRDIGNAQELALRLTAAGLEVEAIDEYGAGADACVVARVESSRPHPTKGSLTLVTVSGGGGATQEVVCGAPNVPLPGGLVVLAPLGAHLPAKGVTIERRTIAGVASEGMLCSEAELGLGDDAAGILVLPPGTGEPGDPFTRVVPNARDTVFEIGLTPNRPDGLGHLGLARELAALFRIAFNPWSGAPPLPPPDRNRLDSRATVVIEDGDRCPHFGGAVLEGAQIGPSPLWLRYRLSALGVRPISTAVDVTNLVMLEFGHPLHAYDLERLRSGAGKGARIVVRTARQGEKLKTLDGVERELVPDDLVIADGEGPIGLGGVMGGEGSEISARTTRIFLECAYFDPRGVRRAARRHGLHTDASHRFERGVDHGDTGAALARAAALTAELTGARLTAGPAIVEVRPIERRTVALRHARLAQLLGAPVPRDESLGILARLGFTARTSSAAEGRDEIEVPTHRPDVAREVDLIEEVARVRGYDKIPSELPAVRPSRDQGEREELLRRARAAAVSMGLMEAATYGFVSARSLEILGAPPPAVVLANPLAEHQSVMRTSLLPGLLDAYQRGRRRGERDARLFALGPLFLEGASTADRLPEERLAFAAVLGGDRGAYLAKPEAVDVWDGKGLALGLVERLTRRSARVRAIPPGERPARLHPRGAAYVEVDVGGDGGAGEAALGVGTLGPLHPDVADALDLAGGDVILVELDLATLGRIGRPPFRYEAIPRFPAALRDVALVVRDGVPAGDVEHVVREAAGALAEEVKMFDRFAGGAVPAGHVSLAFHVVYRARDRTLTDVEVDAQHAKVVAEVGKRFGATLRT